MRFVGQLWVLLVAIFLLCEALPTQLQSQENVSNDDNSVEADLTPISIISNHLQNCPVRQMLEQGVINVTPEMIAMALEQVAMSLRAISATQQAI